MVSVATLGSTEAKMETRQAKRLVINLIKCEVRCPYHGKDVDVFTHCIAKAAHRGCDFYDHLDSMGGIHCTWTEEDGRAEV